jgi:transcriptional regulator
MSDGTMDRMMRMILPFRLIIDTIDGTWKLNQNKPAEARLAAATALEARGGEPAATALAHLMRQAG